MKVKKSKRVKYNVTKTKKIVKNIVKNIYTKSRKPAKKNKKTKKLYKNIKGGNISLPFTPQTKEALVQAINIFTDKSNIEKSVEKYGKMSTWVVSNITDMSNLFEGFVFDDINDIISNWDVTEVKNMSYMFSKCQTFNQPLNSWIVSKVENMSFMFSGCSKFNQSLASWNVSKVMNMTRMFANCRSLRQNFSSWQLALDADTYYMFYNTPIDGKRAFYPKVTIAPRPIPQPIDVIQPINKGVVSYNNVTPSHVEMTTNTILKIDENSKAYDVINLEDISVLTYLQENTNNIAFCFNNGFYITNRDRLKILCNDDSFVKYSCNQVYERLMVTPEMYDNQTPYLVGKAFACPCGLIELSKLKTIVENNSKEYQCFEIIDFNPPKIALSTVSLQMLTIDVDAVGASHCQEGQNETINDIRRVIV